MMRLLRVCLQNLDYGAARATTGGTRVAGAAKKRRDSSRTSASEHDYNLKVVIVRCAALLGLAWLKRKKAKVL